ALSLYFSLQVPVYLEMRRRVDGVPGDEIYVETDAPAPSGPARAPRPPATALPAAPPVRSPFAELCAFLLYVGLTALSWLVLAHTMTWLAGPRADWLRWDLSWPEAPEVAGVDRLAASLAGFWLLVGLLGALVMRLRRQGRRGGPPPAEQA